MPRTPPRPLAVLMILFVTAIPAAAQELTARQTRLLEALPPVEAIVAALPERRNELDATVERRVVLTQFSDMVFYLARDIPEGPLKQRADGYHNTAKQETLRILRHLGVRNPTTTEFWRARPTVTETWARMHGDETATRKVIRELFKETLDGELRDHALDWFNGRISRADEPQFVKDARHWVRELPEPWRGHVSKVTNAPNYVWISICLVWLVLGIATRTVPFRLMPDNVWLLQRARKMLGMAHGHVTVLDIKATEEIQQNINVRVDGYGNAAPAHVHISRKRTLTLFVRGTGGEWTFDVVNQRFDVRVGHTLLVVADARTNGILFVYNHDMREFLRMPELKSFVKMRPWLLIPIAGLALFGGLAVESSPEVKAAVAVVTPLVYLVFMKLVNLTRRERFMSKMAPRLVEAAGPPPEANVIGNSEFSIRRA